jgi:hypothetical protein
MDLKFTKLIRLVFFASEYILFANDLYICSVADFTGTFKADERARRSIDSAYQQKIPEFCIVTTWKKCKITEERFFMI